MLCCLLDSGSFPVAIPVVLSTWYPKPGSNHMPYLREKERKRGREEGEGKMCQDASSTRIYTRQYTSTAHHTQY